MARSAWPEVAFVAGLRSSRLPAQTACQLPGQPTVTRMKFALTDQPRLWSAPGSTVTRELAQRDDALALRPVQADAQPESRAEPIYHENGPACLAANRVGAIFSHGGAVAAAG